MQIIESVCAWQEIRKNLSARSLGFVPTMGNLHAGHTSLIAKSATENDQTIVSVFVNPTQFNNQSDLKNYPRTLQADIELASGAGANYLLLPTYQDLYQDNYSYRVVEFSDLSAEMEGRQRPGHFTGMLTIVLKLLLLVGAKNAYFGEKDYQQYLLVKDMVKSFFIGTKIIACPTIRNEAGLALSSRNNLLSAEGLVKAADFARLLASGLPNIEEQLKQQGFIVEYVKEQYGRRFGAVSLGGIRLIDNVEI